MSKKQLDECLVKVRSHCMITLLAAYACMEVQLLTYIPVYYCRQRPCGHRKESENRNVETNEVQMFAAWCTGCLCGAHLCTVWAVD